MIKEKKETETGKKIETVTETGIEIATEIVTIVMGLLHIRDGFVRGQDRDQDDPIRILDLHLHVDDIRGRVLVLDLEIRITIEIRNDHISTETEIIVDINPVIIIVALKVIPVIRCIL